MENQVKNLENELESILNDFVKTGCFSSLEQVNKLLTQEYEKEISDQLNFLRNTAIMAGVVAPFSLTLLSEQSLGIGKIYLLFGFVFLIITILITLLSTKKITLDYKYKDTPSLFFNHTIASTAAFSIRDINTSLTDRVNMMHEIVTSLDDVNHLYEQNTLKLVCLREKLSISNRWSIFLFSSGLILIILSVLYSYLINLFAFFFVLVI